MSLQQVIENAYRALATEHFQPKSDTPQQVSLLKKDSK
ncbi:hypothetical protein SB6415_02121 [Klebsiella pasteurii]|nr:hypothetical protein SB6415_02121 [Klebsiella pasteurii]